MYPHQNARKRTWAIEKREHFLSTKTAWLPQKAGWANLNAIGAVKSTVEEKDEIAQKPRFFHYVTDKNRRVCHGQ
jgi:hypothetical protein